MQISWNMENLMLLQHVQIVFNPTMQYLWCRWGYFNLNTNFKLKYLKFCYIFFYNDDYDIDVQINESNFSYI